MYFCFSEHPNTQNASCTETLKFSLIETLSHNVKKKTVYTLIFIPFHTCCECRSFKYTHNLICNYMLTQLKWVSLRSYPCRQKNRNTPQPHKGMTSIYNIYTQGINNINNNTKVKCPYKKFPIDLMRICRNHKSNVFSTFNIFKLHSTFVFVPFPQWILCACRHTEIFTVTDCILGQQKVCVMTKMYYVCYYSAAEEAGFHVLILAKILTSQSYKAKPKSVGRTSLNWGRHFSFILWALTSVL